MLIVPRSMKIVVVQKRSVVPWIILFVILKLGLVSATKEKNIFTLHQLVNVKKLKVSI